MTTTSTAINDDHADKAITVADVEQFLYAEARSLDDRDFETWLSFYAPNVVYHMPAWDDDDLLTEDPQREISLIYYGTKQGLEDRVFRINTERSSATSLPIPRTSHNISNVEIVERGPHSLKIRFNWFNLSFRYKTTDTYWGTSYYTVDTSGPKPLITYKKIVLKNDYIHHVVDIYHI